MGHQPAHRLQKAARPIPPAAVRRCLLVRWQISSPS